MSNMDYLSYLHDYEHGYVNDLKDMFGEEGLHQMEAMGYIVNAPSKDGETWRRSSRASELVNARERKSSFIERVLDCININIRKVDYSI